MTEINNFCREVSELSVLADMLANLVTRIGFGVNNACWGLLFPANGDDGMVDMLLLWLRPILTLSSRGSLLPLRF